MSSKDNLGDRIKNYERLETDQYLIPMLPTVIRLDGRSFSKYTKSFQPFDNCMSYAMEETTKYLVKETNAIIGYTQSDEITLILYSDSVDSQVFFNGKKHKLLSNLPSMASVKFYESLLFCEGSTMPKNLLPSFDCRLFQVPTKMEAWNALLWRVQDCIKNSVQMLAQHHFSHKSLQGKNQKEQLTMLSEDGILWDDLPQKFKEGILISKEPYNKIVDGVPVQRTRIAVINDDFEFNKIENRIEFLFDGESPRLFNEYYA